MNEKARQELTRISDKFPAVPSVPREWDIVVRLVKQGQIAKAEAHAHDYVYSSPKMIARNKTAVTQRISRKEFLKMQVQTEKATKEIMVRLTDRINKRVLNAAEYDGKIPIWKTNALLKAAKQINNEEWLEFKKLMTKGITTSVKMGITHTMDAAQIGMDKRKQLEEGVQSAEIGKTTILFKSIFDKVKKRRLKMGLFKNRLKGGYQVSFSLSQRIWDLRDWSHFKIRSDIAAGIAQGRAASAIAQDIQKHTWVGGGVSRVIEPTPGRGVYNTAYKNALRVVRTETNNAYHEAEIEYAAEKGYKKMWNVNQGCPLCDPLQGQIFDAEDVPPKPHPNCFFDDTMILMGDKSEKKISDIRVGEMVIGKSGNSRKVFKVHKNKYQGDMYRIVFTNNKQFLVTGNHPIHVIGHGWINADRLEKGNEMLSYKKISVCSDVNNSPSQCIKISFLSKVLQFLFRSSMPIPPVNFNSNHLGSDGNVNIVLTNSKQGNILNSKFIKYFHYGNLALRQFAYHLNRLCSFAKAAVTSFHTSNSIMRSLYCSFSFCFAVSSPDKFPGSRSSSPSEIMLFKSSKNTTATYLKRFRNTFNALSGKVSFVNNVDIESNNFAHSMPPIVNVKSIRKEHYSGYVYNLTVTDDQSYYAESILVKNCGCHLSTVIPGLT